MPYYITRVLKRSFVFGLSELDNPLEPDWKVRLMIPGVLAFNDSDQEAGSDDKASGVISPKSRRESPGPVTHNQFGQTVGTPCALFPHCGLTWLHIRPVVNLQAWPFTYRPEARAFTSISTWEIEDWIVGENEAYYENSKRINYLRFANLPKNLHQELELAVYMTDEDADERNLMENGGWKIRLSMEAAGTPERYQSYIQDSRGEFSVVKPSCIFFQNAWMSDRLLCYLASGKPVVVQNTGPSVYLPDGDGLLRLSNAEQAVTAFESINRSYLHHCKSAREIAEEYFDSQKVLSELLNRAIWDR